MAKTPRYKQMGLTKRYNEKGTHIGYVTPSGERISNRQYKAMVGTPLPGSPGYKERQAAKAEGKDYRPEYFPRGRLKDTEKLKNYAKRPGATREGYKKGHEKEVPMEVYNVQERHFAAVKKQRFDSIEFKYEAGLIDRKEWQRLRDHAWTETETRERLAQIWERLDQDISNSERRRLEQEYLRLKKKYDHAHKQLDKAGVVPPRESDLEHGYYHP